jgi:hypothetical protein
MVTAAPEFVILVLVPGDVRVDVVLPEIFDDGLHADALFTEHSRYECTVTQVDSVVKSATLKAVEGGQ